MTRECRTLTADAGDDWMYSTVHEGVLCDISVSTDQRDKSQVYLLALCGTL